MTKIRNNTGSKIHNGFEVDLNDEDSALFETAGDYITGRLDMEDVHNDPAYAETKISVDWMIEYYNNNKCIRTDNEKFIKEILSNKDAVVLQTENELGSIKKEIKDNKLNDITAEWVKEWHEKKQKAVAQSVKSEEISDFVKGALQTEEKQKTILPDGATRRNPVRAFVKYASFAAAALLGIFMIIRTLIPSDPGTIFSSYYKPFDAMSVVTRSMKISSTDIYSTAIARYKSGDFATAYREFNTISGNDPGQEASRFYMGLSLMGLEKYTQAIPLLSEVTAGQGEFGKDARWYLGLAYLKVSDMTKARECFEYLAGSEGFYRDRSEKILRRLK